MNGMTLQIAYFAPNMLTTVTPPQNMLVLP